MLTGDRRNLDAAQHAGDFFDPCLPLDCRNAAANLTSIGNLADLPLPVGACGNLWQMRYAENLPFASQLAQQTADYLGNTISLADFRYKKNVLLVFNRTFT